MTPLLELAAKDEGGDQPHDRRAGDGSRGAWMVKIREPSNGREGCKGCGEAEYLSKERFACILPLCSLLQDTAMRSFSLHLVLKP